MDEAFGFQELRFRFRIGYISFLLFRFSSHFQILELSRVVLLAFSTHERETLALRSQGSRVSSVKHPATGILGRWAYCFGIVCKNIIGFGFVGDENVSSAKVKLAFSVR